MLDLKSAASTLPTSSNVSKDNIKIGSEFVNSLELARAKMLEMGDSFIALDTWLMANSQNEGQAVSVPVCPVKQEFYCLDNCCVCHGCSEIRSCQLDTGIFQRNILDRRCGRTSSVAGASCWHGSRHARHSNADGYNMERKQAQSCDSVGGSRSVGGCWVLVP